MYAATGTGGELILTNKTEKQLASRLLRNFVIGITCTIVGAVVITGVIVWAPLPQASQAQAQSDLAALQHDDNFVGGDLRALSSDAHMTVTLDVAAMKNDLANRTASGLPAAPGATAAIAAAGKAIGQAAAKASAEIDQVNADVTQAYSIANGLATGSCAGDGPGRPPVPIGHIPSN